MPRQIFDFNSLSSYAKLLEIFVRLGCSEYTDLCEMERFLLTQLCWKEHLKIAPKLHQIINNYWLQGISPRGEVAFYLFLTKIICICHEAPGFAPPHFWSYPILAPPLIGSWEIPWFILDKSYLYPFLKN